ncbi:MAG: ATP-binding protein [Cyanobacteria bacterium P01_A01_bin.17]
MLIDLLGGAPVGSTSATNAHLETALSCRIVARITALPAAEPHLALAQLLAQIRGVLISLLSYTLQTPLSTIQTTVETLFEGDIIPAQAQLSMIQLSLAELNRISVLIENFLSYINQVWALTLDFAQFRPSQQSATYLKSMFAALPDTFKEAQPWIEEASARLMPFLDAVSNIQGERAELIWPQERALLEQAWRQMLAIVNHELRTPFTTLMVCLETLETDADASLTDRLAFLEIASDDIKRLGSLGQDLELLSRLSAGQVWFRTELVDLTALFESTLSSFLRQVPEATPANLKIEPLKDVSLVWADGDHLAAVIQRLLENAYRFTAATGEITVRAHVEIDENEPSVWGEQGELSTLSIDVSDSGQGIERGKLTCVFECFYQEEGYLRRTQGGIGIGLTICRYLIEGMGGRIWAESSGKAQGSRFCLRLPVYEKKGDNDSLL